MDTLEKLKQKITEFEARSAAKDEIKSFTTLLLQVLKASKESFDSLTEDNLKTIKEAIAYIEQEHSKTLETVNRETTTTKQEFAKQLKEVKDLVAKVKTIKPVDGIDGQDGYTPVKGQDYFTDKDIKDIKDSVLEDIPEQTGEEIVEKINALPIDDADKKIDASHIKNLPEQVRYYAGNSGIKEIIAGTNITVDNSNLGYPVISSTGGGSGTPGGSDTQLQYNNAGSFGGILGATTNGTAVTYSTGNLIATDVKASGSGGLHLHNNTGQDCFLVGLGGGINNTAYGALKLDFATATTVPYLDASKNLISSAVTPTELGYLSGVTSAIQTQLNAKQASDAQLTSLAGLSYTGNAGKFIRVNAGETDFELATIAGSGTVTDVSVVSANGFAGTVATSTTTPAITLSTTITGLLKGNGTAISAATAGTDYSAGTSALGTGILKSTTGTGALTIAVAGDFPTLNQNTTGSAATLTTTRTIWGQNFNGSANVTGDITLGASSITMTGSLAATGARVTKGWFTDIESTNMPTVGGTSLSSTFQASLSGASLTAVTVATDDKVLIQDTSDSNNLKTVTAQSIANLASKYITWNTLASGGSVTMSVNNGYIVDGTLYSTQTLTLPTSSSVGDIIAIQVSYSNGAGSTTQIAQGSGQYILYNLGNTQTSTTVGASGYLQSTVMSTIYLICTVANTGWQVIEMVGSWSDQSSNSTSAIGISYNDLVTGSSTTTFTNKRINPRVSSASSGNISPNIANFDMYIRTALSATCTISAPTGTPLDGNELTFRLLDNGTTRTLSWNATYTAIGVTLPTATTANKMIYVKAVYNSANTRWDVIQVNQQA